MTTPHEDDTRDRRHGLARTGAKAGGKAVGSAIGRKIATAAILPLLGLGTAGGYELFDRDCAGDWVKSSPSSCSAPEADDNED